MAGRQECHGGSASDHPKPRRAGLRCSLTRCAALARVRTLAVAFTHLLAQHDASAATALDPWLTAAAASELRGFAASVRRDRAAVLAALLFPWSNGQTEGQVHRVKLLKRAIYGRAAFPLLRQRVLHAA